MFHLHPLEVSVETHKNHTLVIVIIGLNSKTNRPEIFMVEQ